MHLKCPSCHRFHDFHLLDFVHKTTLANPYHIESVQDGLSSASVHIGATPAPPRSGSSQSDELQVPQSLRAAVLLVHHSEWTRDCLHPSWIWRLNCVTVHFIHDHFSYISIKYLMYFYQFANLLLTSEKVINHSGEAPCQNQT